MGAVNETLTASTLGISQKTSRSGFQQYALRHPDLPDLSLHDVWLDKDLVLALNSAQPLQALRELAYNECQDVYSFQFLQPRICQKLREETVSASRFAASIGIASPGLLLSGRWYLGHLDTRYNAVFDRIIKEVIQQLDVALFASTSPLTYHHDYCIRFGCNGDRSLKVHTDNSDMTINTFLGGDNGEIDHVGADLLLLTPTDEDTRCGTPRLDREYQGSTFKYRHNQIGRAVIHPGDKWHAVDSLQHGSRWNLLHKAMRDDADWKRTFYQETDEYLSKKASNI